MLYLPNLSERAGASLKLWLSIWLSVWMLVSCGTLDQEDFALHSAPSSTSAYHSHWYSYSLSSGQIRNEASPETLELLQPPKPENPLLLTQVGHFPLTYSGGAAVAARSGWFRWQGYGTVLSAAVMALAITTAMTAIILPASTEFPEEGDSLIPQQQQKTPVPKGQRGGGVPDPLFPFPWISHDKGLENWQENFPLKGKAQIEEDPTIQSHSAVLRQRLPYALEDVYGVLTDYRHFNQFMPHTKKSEVIKQSGPDGSTKWVDYTLVFLMWVETQYVLKITHDLNDDHAKISWTLDSGENFQDIRGTWLLRKLPASPEQSPQTAVTYVSVIQPKITIPRAVFDAITKKSIYELFEAISKRLKATHG